MFPLGNVTSSAANTNGKGSVNKRAAQVSLFISWFILASLIDANLVARLAGAVRLTVKQTRNAILACVPYGLPSGA